MLLTVNLASLIEGNVVNVGLYTLLVEVIATSSMEEEIKSTLDSI